MGYKHSNGLAISDDFLLKKTAKVKLRQQRDILCSYEKKRDLCISSRVSVYENTLHQIGKKCVWRN